MNDSDAEVPDIQTQTTNVRPILLAGAFVAEGKIKGHAQQLGWSQRNSASNAKTIGARTASDGEFVFSTTVKASKDEASHDCRGRIRAEFDRLVRTATPIEFFRSVSETQEGGMLPCRTVSRCLQDAEHPTCPLTLAFDRDWLKESDLPTSSRATA